MIRENSMDGYVESGNAKKKRTESELMKKWRKYNSTQKGWYDDTTSGIAKTLRDRGGSEKMPDRPGYKKLSFGQWKKMQKDD